MTEFKSQITYLKKRKNLSCVLHKFKNTQQQDDGEKSSEAINNFSFVSSSGDTRLIVLTIAELGMTKRKDVVLKSLLRSCVRKDFMLYSNNLTRKNDRYIVNLRKRLKEFIFACMQAEPIDILIDSLGVFIITEQIEDSLYQLRELQHKFDLGRMIREVREALYKFSFTRLSNLFDYPGLRETILHFCRIYNQDLLDGDEKVGLQILLEQCQHEL